MHDFEKLARGFVTFTYAKEGSAEYEDYFWAFDAFAEMCLSDPGPAWHAILKAVEIDSGPKILGALSAGPLEDLLVANGHAVIEAIEDSARVNPQIAALLGGVWKSDIEEDVWRRVVAARSHAW